MATNSDVTIKAGGYVVAPKPTVITAKPSVTTTTPGGVTIQASGYVTEPTVAEIKAIEVKAREQAKIEGKDIEQILVTVTAPDQPEIRTITLGDMPAVIEPKLEGGIYFHGRGIATPEWVERGVLTVGNFLSVKPEEVQGKYLTHREIVPMPESLMTMLMQTSKIINVFAPPQPEVDIYKEPLKFMGEAITTGATWMIPYVYVSSQWKNLTTTEKVINLAIDTALTLSIVGRPLIGGVRRGLARVLGKEGSKVVTPVLKDLNTAIKVGDVDKVRLQARRLEVVGNEMQARNIHGAATIITRAKVIEKQAMKLAGQRSIMTKAEVRQLRTLTKKLTAQMDKAVKIEIVEPRKAVGAQELRQPIIHQDKMGTKTLVMPVTSKEAGMLRSAGITESSIMRTFERAGYDAAVARRLLTEQYRNSRSLWTQVNKMAETRTRTRPTPPEPGIVKAKPETAGLPERGYSLAEIEEMRKAGTLPKYISREEWERMWKPSVAKAKAKPVVTLPQPTVEVIKPKLGRIGKFDMAEYVRQAEARGIAKEAVAETIAKANPREAIQLVTNLAIKLATVSLTKGKTMTQAKTAVQTMLKTMTATATKIATKTALTTSTDTITETAVDTATKLQTQAETAAKTKARAETKTETKTKADTVTKAATKVATKLAIRLTAKVGKVKTEVKEKGETRIRTRIRVRLPGGGYKTLTRKEAEGIIAWKMGWCYKMLYPPYGEKQIVNSRKPLAGVKYYSGAGSAAKSIIAKGGVIPAEITRDMGIQDVIIRTPPYKKSKPRIHFRRDIKQRTRTTPRVSSISTIRR